MTLSGKSLALYQGVSALFCTTVVVSNLISAKMVQLPLFEGFSVPAGLLTYPLTFILSDLATELFDSRLAKQMVYHALGASLLAYALIMLAMWLPGSEHEASLAFREVFGWNGLIVSASLTAFVTAQLLDVRLYAWIKQWTGDHHLWLRNNGSTLLSQFVDTLLVNIIHLYLGRGMPMNTVVQIMLFAYTYKALLSMINTPLYYFLVSYSKRYISPPMQYDLA